MPWAIFFHSGYAFDWRRAPLAGQSLIIEGKYSFYLGKVGNNSLSQRDAAIIAGHLPVGEYLKAACFQ